MCVSIGKYVVMVVPLSYVCLFSVHIYIIYTILVHFANSISYFDIVYLFCSLFTKDQIAYIHNMTMYDVIVRCTDINADAIQKDVFHFSQGEHFNNF